MPSKFRYCILIAAWFYSTLPSCADQVEDLRKVIKVVESGRILSIDHIPGDPDRTSMKKKNHAVLEAVQSFAKGRTQAEIRELLGEPGSKESKIPITNWPDTAAKSDELWLYICGDCPGLGYVVALCFANGVCSEAYELSGLQVYTYLNWKCDLIQAYSVGKTADEIIRKFGEPTNRNAEKQMIGRPGDDKRKPYDQAWEYRVLREPTVWLGFLDGKCVRTELFDTLH